MKIAAVLIGLMFLFTATAQSQQTDNSRKVSLSWSGFVNAVAIVDTRQVVEAREGFLLLYPKNFQADSMGYDINDRWSFNQYAMTTRLQLKATGPDLGKAKSLAIIEGDFTGASNAENNSFRLRHAYLKLSWPHLSVLAGQYWHPLNIPEMIPSVLSLNTGAPYHPFSRQPQVRIDAKKGLFNFVIAATAQRDYYNTGPAGQSSIYLRNSALPNLHAQVHFEKENFFAGAGYDYKRLAPRLVTEKKFKTDEHLNTQSFTGFFKWTLKPVVLKGQVVYGQALNDHLMPGGYAVSYIDPVTDRRKYTALNYLSAWLGACTTGTGFQYSLFTGLSKGYGCNEIVVGPVFARDPDINYTYRISPMVAWIISNFNLSAELEYTAAVYNDAQDLRLRSYKAGNHQEENFRLSVQVQYKF